MVLRGAATGLLLALLQRVSACFDMQAKRVLVAFCTSRKFKLPGLKELFLALQVRFCCGALWLAKPDKCFISATVT